jgi:hypothetical protein
MSTLWTDYITPAELTGYARAALADYEESKGSLARWLPNREVADIVARFVAGQTGLIDVADFRAYDAEPSIGSLPGGKRVTIELPALGKQFPISEYNQLRTRNAAGDDQVRQFIQNTTKQVVRSVADAMERMRGIVLSTGRATIANVDGFTMDDGFGRSAGHDLTAGTLWDSATSVSRLAYLQTIIDTYIADNGEAPGAILTSTKVLRVLGQGDEFKNQLGGGGTRVATPTDVNAVLDGYSFPPITVYDRNVKVAGSTVRVTPANKLFLLPAAVDPNDWEGTELGATFWGQTLSSGEPGWNIEPSEQPGIVVGAYRNEKPPMIAEVVPDAIGLPVLANADLSLAAQVIT